MPTNTPTDPQQNNPFLQQLNLQKYDDVIAKSTEYIQQNTSQKQIVNQVPQQVAQPQAVNPFQNLINEQALKQMNPIPNPAQVLPALPQDNFNQPTVDPTILAQSLQQFPQGTPTQILSQKGNPELAGNSVDTSSEKRAEEIVEELRSIETKPEQPKKEEAKKVSDLEEEQKPKDHAQKQASQIGEIKVYGYKVPQQVLKLGQKVDDLKALGDTASAKTWLYALVGRIIAMKLPHENDQSS